MRFGVFAYKLSVIVAAAAAVSALGCAGTARAPRTLPAIELPVSGPAVAISAAPPPPEAPARPQPREHVVRPGETLWSIARRYGSSVEALARVNALTDPGRLVVDQRLRIPDGSAGARSTASRAEPRRPVVDAPMHWPIPGGRLLSPFGVDRRTHRHSGIDIAGSRGEPVLAAARGRVSYSGASMRGYGKTVMIDHGEGLSTLYAHNSRLLVRVGDRVDAGQPIARVGRSGNATADHCHFEIRERDRPVDPARYVGSTETAAR